MRASGRGEAVWACERGVFVNAGGLHSNISCSSSCAVAFVFLLVICMVLSVFHGIYCYVCFFLCVLLVIYMVFQGFFVFYCNCCYLHGF